MLEKILSADGNAFITDPKLRKAAQKPPASIDADGVRQVFEHCLDVVPYFFWGWVREITSERTPILLTVLDGNERLGARALATAYRVGGVECLREMSAFYFFITKSTNLPGCLKRLPKLERSDALAEAARIVVLETIPVEAPWADSSGLRSGLEIVPYWSLVWVAGWEHPDVLDELRIDAAGPLERVRKLLHRAGRLE